LVVGISQSGETTDTFQALREARRRHAKVLVVSNVVDSSMARESDGVLYTCLFATRGVALRDKLRSGASDDSLVDLLRDTWRARTDNYSEQRQTRLADVAGERKVEMFYIGG
jgi:DNA-binding MurR/RpiR family transcriptional regulator